MRINTSVVFKLYNDCDEAGGREIYNRFMRVLGELDITREKTLELEAIYNEAITQSIDFTFYKCVKNV